MIKPNHIFLILGLLLLGVAKLAAQAPFTGGLGDGYARASLERSLALNPDRVAGIYWGPQPLKNGQPLVLQQKAQPLQDASIQLFDLTGRQLFSQQVSPLPRQSFRFPPLASGTYLIQLNSRSGHSHHKLIID